MRHQSRISDRKDKQVRFYVNQKDYDRLNAEYEVSGYSSVSAYLRKKIIGNGIVIPDTKELKNTLDAIGYQYERIGNNINQVAKKVHLFTKEGRFPPDGLTRFNKLMQQYLSVTEDLSRAHSAFLRQMSK